MQQGGQTSDFNASQICAINAPMERMPQFSLGIQRALESEEAIHTFECVPIEDAKKMILEYFLDDETNRAARPLRSTGVCIASMNPRYRLEDGLRVHNVTWGLGGFQRCKNYWKAANGAYVGFACVFLEHPNYDKGDPKTHKIGYDPKVEMIACTFEQNSTLCNRGLSSAEPSTWDSVVHRFSVLESVRQRSNMVLNADLDREDGFQPKKAWFLSIGMLTESPITPSPKDSQCEIVRTLKQLDQEGSGWPIGLIVDLQDIGIVVEGTDVFYVVDGKKTAIKVTGPDRTKVKEEVAKAVDEGYPY